MSTRSIEFPTEFPDLEGDRVHLKAFSPQDVEPFFRLRSDEEFMKYLAMNPMKSMAEARSRLSTIIEDFKTARGINWKICLKGGDELIGYIGIWRIDDRNFRGEIGFGLDQAYQQKGLMSESMPLALQYGIKQLGLHTLKADVDPRNTASIQLLEKNNFVKEAHLRENYYFGGEFMDSIYYGLREQDLQS